MQKKSRDEEKVFSVTMTEEELSLFSEFLEQREYARADYRGLDSATRRNLLKARNIQAKELKAARRTINKYYEHTDSSGRENALRVSKAKSDRLTKVARGASETRRDINSNSGLNPIQKLRAKSVIDNIAWKHAGREYYI